MAQGKSTQELLVETIGSAGSEKALDLLRSLLEPEGEFSIATRRVADDLTSAAWTKDHKIAGEGDQGGPEDLGDNWWLCPACSDAFESTTPPSECQLCKEPFAAPAGRVAELAFGGRGKLWLGEAGDYAHAEGGARTWTSYSSALAKRALDTDLVFSHASLHQAIVLGEDGEGLIFYRQGNELWSCQRGTSEPTRESEAPKLGVARRLLQCLVGDSEWKQLTTLAAEGEKAEARQRILDQEETLARQNRVIADWRSSLIGQENLAEAFVAHFGYLAEDAREKDWLAEIAKRVESVRLAPKRPGLHFAFRVDDEPCTLGATLPSQASGEHMPGLGLATAKHDCLELLLGDGTPIFSTAGLDNKGALEQHPCFIEDPEDKVALMLFDYESYVMLDADGALFTSEEGCLSPLPPLRYPGLCLRFLAVAVLGGHYKKYLGE